jgi:hypothetical protein
MLVAFVLLLVVLLFVPLLVFVLLPFVLLLLLFVLVASLPLTLPVQKLLRFLAYGQGPLPPYAPLLLPRAPLPAF